MLQIYYDYKYSKHITYCQDFITNLLQTQKRRNHSLHKMQKTNDSVFTLLNF